MIGGIRTGGVRGSDIRLNGVLKYMDKIMYITGSFPRLGDGIGDAAGRLYGAMPDKKDIKLVTTDDPAIKGYIKEKRYQNVTLVEDWRLGSVNGILKKIKKERIHKVLIEYAGNGYGRDLAISFLPLRIKVHDLFAKEKVECHLRLHEFTMCRPTRKLFTYPLVWFCDHLDTPSFVEYLHLKERYGNKVVKSAIGSNINWRTEKKEFKKKPGDKIKLAFFGGIYPGKGIEKLIAMWGEIEKRYPGVYDYQLLGGFPEGRANVFDNYQASVQKLIEKKGLKDKIMVSGFLPEGEIESWLDQVDIAVLPYEDGLTLRRGSFLAFLGRNVAVVTSMGDPQASVLFRDARGVKMCSGAEEMIKAIRDYSENDRYYEAGLDNARFQDFFNWERIAETVLGCFTD